MTEAADIHHEHRDRPSWGVLRGAPDEGSRHRGLTVRTTAADAGMGLGLVEHEGVQVAHCRDRKANDTNPTHLPRETAARRVESHISCALLPPSPDGARRTSAIQNVPGHESWTGHIPLLIGDIS